MTVQRQYILPNCNLTVEGLTTGDETDPMAPMTVVLNSECFFPGTAYKLSGGREFLNDLVKSVSQYTQSLLSGVPYPLANEDLGARAVSLQPTENERHRLNATVSQTDGTPKQETLELDTIQLFDLMEAIDQLVADTQTLPDMKLDLAPLSRRHARPAVPATKRALPAAVGLSTLAASATLLFLVPVPEFEPERRETEEISQQIEEESDTLPADNADDDADVVSETEADVAEEPEDTPTAETETAVVESVETVDPVEAGIALSRLAGSEAIADRETLASLEDQVARNLEEALDADVAFEDSLVYRVAVSESGDVLGYKYENDAALENVDSTPLPEVTFIPIDAGQGVDEPIAQLRVTFEPDGSVIAEAIDPEGDGTDAAAGE